MRWKTYAATRSPDAYSRLVNLFTAGHGYIEVAVRLALANRDAPTILHHVDQACRYLAAVHALLVQPAVGETVRLSPPATALRYPAGRWCDYLRTRTTANTEQVSAALATSLRHAGQVAASMRRDGEVADATENVALSIGCLERVLWLYEDGRRG